MIFEELHNYHDHRYVLTTKHYKDRHENLKKELKGWDLELFFGVDRKDYGKVYFIKEGIYDEELARKNNRHRNAMNAGEICCALGHKMIYEDFLSKSYEKILIFEDDVLIIPENETFVEEMIKAIPDDAEMIYWGWFKNEKPPFYASIKQAIYRTQHSIGWLNYNHTMIQNIYPRPFNDYFSIAGQHIGIHSYTLTRKGAEKIIRWQTPITYNADDAIMYAILNNDLRAYICFPQLFSQASLDRKHKIKTLTEINAP